MRGEGFAGALRRGLPPAADPRERVEHSQLGARRDVRQPPRESLPGGVSHPVLPFLGLMLDRPIGTFTDVAETVQGDADGLGIDREAGLLSEVGGEGARGPVGRIAPVLVGVVLDDPDDFGQSLFAQGWLGSTAVTPWDSIQTAFVEATQDSPDGVVAAKDESGNLRRAHLAVGGEQDHLKARATFGVRRTVKPIEQFLALCRFERGEDQGTGHEETPLAKYDVSQSYHQSHLTSGRI